jgi:hypothetical protein
MRRLAIAFLLTTGCYQGVRVATPTYAEQRVLDASHIDSTAPADVVRTQACGLPPASEASGAGVMLDLRVGGERCSEGPPPDGAIPLNFAIERRSGRVEVAIDAPNAAVLDETRNDLLLRLDDVRLGTASHVERRLDVPATAAIIAVSLVLATASIAGIVALALDSMSLGWWPTTCCAW